jgi:hypothetical protein
MRRRLLARPLLSALVVGLLAAGCESSTAPGLPEPLAPPLHPTLAAAPQPYEQVEGTVPSFDLEAVIGPEGGSIGTTGFYLTVPRGAVKEPTVFTFRSANTGYVAVVLTATSPGSRTQNDVGAAGFPIPLTLSLSYEPAGGMPKWAQLVVAWVRPDGTLEPVPSGFNPVLRVIVGKIDHFSQFTLAGN